MIRHWRRLSLLAAVTAGLVGCGGGKKPWEKVYPVKGSVVYKGEPLSRAMITLIPQDPEFPETVRPTAMTKEDGTFEVGTYGKSDGAPAGEYKALVLHYPVLGPKENPVAGPNDLPKKYARAETTDLVVNIEPNATELPPLEIVEAVPNRGGKQ